MRQWDCERKDHIKDKPEDDARNWGLQFLKDLITISRVKKGELAQFHVDLRIKVEEHVKAHPWARLADIKAIKEDYCGPPRTHETKTLDPSTIEIFDAEATSDDSYFEELVEPQPTGPKKRGRPTNESRRLEKYEARIQKSRPRKSKF